MEIKPNRIKGHIYLKCLALCLALRSYHYNCIRGRQGKRGLSAKRDMENSKGKCRILINTSLKI